MFLLESERLVIRPWRAEDRATFHTLMSLPEITRYLHGGVPYSDAETDEWLGRQARQMAEFDVCMGAAVEKSSGQIVGIAGTQPLGTTGHYEIGWIFSPDVWGRGYATEAGRAAMDHVLETLNHDRVLAIIDPDNEPSKKVATRLGMSLDGRVTGTQLGHRKPDIVVDLFYRDKN